MDKIKYELDKDGVHLLTGCPKGKKTDMGFVVMVGSGFCRECPQFHSDDMRGTVECKEEDS